jgi:hypothetical protein
MSQELVKIIIEYTVFGVLGFLVSQRKTFFKWITNLAESHSKLNSHDLFNIINDKRVNTIKYIKFQSNLELLKKRLCCLSMINLKQILKIKNYSMHVLIFSWT